MAAVCAVAVVNFGEVRGGGFDGTAAQRSGIGVTSGCCIDGARAIARFRDALRAPRNRVAFGIGTMQCLVPGPDLVAVLVGRTAHHATIVGSVGKARGGPYRRQCLTRLARIPRGRSAHPTHTLTRLHPRDRSGTSALGITASATRQVGAAAGSSIRLNAVLLGAVTCDAALTDSLSGLATAAPATKSTGQRSW